MTKIVKVLAFGLAGAGGTVGKVAQTIALIGAGIVTGNPQMILAGISRGASLLKKPKSSAISAATMDRLNVSIITHTPRVMVFGRTAFATDLRDQEFTGSDKEYLHRFIVCAAHKVNAFQEIWFDDELAWTAAGGVQGRFAGYLTVTLRTEGTAANAVNLGARMGTTRRFTGCAYIQLTFKLTGASSKVESPFASQVPTRMTIIGEGIPCYDPRQDSTRGGSGAHRADNQATWTYGTHARNPACQIATWMLGWRIQNPQSGTWKLSVGQGIPPARIDWASIITAANLCDEAVTLAAGGTEPRYRGDGLVTDAQSPEEISDMFKAAMNADLDDQDGLFALSVFHNDLATPVASFTEADVQDDYLWLQTPDLSGGYNVVRGSYIDPSNTALYQPLPYPEARIASPDGLERVHNANFSLVQSRGQAARLAKQRLQRELYGGTFRATFLASGWKARKNSVITLSFAPEGWTNKLFRVVEHEVAQNGLVPMLLLEENAAIYAWSAEEGPAVTLPAPTLYNPGNSPIIQMFEDVAGAPASVQIRNGAILNSRSAIDVPKVLMASLNASGTITVTVAKHDWDYPGEGALVTRNLATVTLLDDGVTPIPPGSTVAIYFDDATMSASAVTYKATLNSDNALNSVANPARHPLGLVACSATNGGTASAGAASGYKFNP